MKALEILRRNMLAVLGAALVATALPVETSAETRVIRNDNGGLVSSRMREVNRLRSRGDRVEIRGQCLSACTMLLGSGNVCVSPNASFGFHGPSSYGRRLQSQDFETASRNIASHYNSRLRSWYMRQARHRINGYHRVSGRELINMGYRQC